MIKQIAVGVLLLSPGVVLASSPNGGFCYTSSDCNSGSTCCTGKCFSNATKPSCGCDTSTTGGGGSPSDSNSSGGAGGAGGTGGTACSTIAEICVVPGTTTGCCSGMACAGTNGTCCGSRGSHWCTGPSVGINYCCSGVCVNGVCD